jgi:hypothetical protein
VKEAVAVVERNWVPLFAKLFSNRLWTCCLAVMEICDVFLIGYGDVAGFNVGDEKSPQAIPYRREVVLQAS